MAQFDPVSAVAGGLLIGLATLILMALGGRIAGISGIFAGLIDTGRGAKGWRLAFLAGLVVAPLAVAIGRHAAVPTPTMPAWAIVIAGGLLVGFGTRLSGGCTSGHGVCGIAGLSPRSIAATCTFMLAAAVVVALTRHVLGGL